jgi:hypothetical protein
VQAWEVTNEAVKGARTARYEWCGFALEAVDEFGELLFGAHADRVGFSCRKGTTQRKKSVFMPRALWQKSVKRGLFEDLYGLGVSAAWVPWMPSGIQTDIRPSRLAQEEPKF